MQPWRADGPRAREEDPRAVSRSEPGEARTGQEGKEVMLTHAPSPTRLGIALLLVAAITGVATGDGVPDRQVSRASVPPPLDFGDSAFDAAARVALAEVPPEEHDDLHNVYRLSESIISGSEPHGEEALRRIAEMGVRTVLSVDGKIPDAETARALGMRYVHVPIQYSGITDEEVARIVKTFRELPGPFFVHCFHGKHRGPAAAAIGRLVVDGAPREHAMAEMRQWCGTSSKYEGLYRTVAAAEIPGAEETRRLDWSFPAAHPFEGLRHSMVEMARTYDHLKASYRRGWRVDPDHPDVDPRNEADKMISHFERALGLDEMDGKPADFLEWLRSSADLSRRLRDALHEGSDASREEAGTLLKSLKESCTACHDRYRN